MKNKHYNLKNGKSKIKIANLKICDTLFSKTLGIMFQKNPKNMLFIFSKPGKTAIHSFFCRKKFLAIWLLGNRVIDAKIVSPWTFHIAPRKKFDKLLELPFNDSREISKFTSILERFKY